MSVLVKFDNVTKHNARKIRRRVTMVFQDFNLFPHLSILDNAVLGPVKSLKQPRKMDEGQLVETKPPKEFFENPEHKSARQFLDQIL